MRRLFTETFSCVSRFINVLSGGTADMTLSARAYQDGLCIEKWIDAAFRLLTGERNHCRNWYLIEVERSRRVLETYRTRLLLGVLETYRTRLLLD